VLLVDDFWDVLEVMTMLLEDEECVGQRAFRGAGGVGLLRGIRRPNTLRSDYLGIGYAKESEAINLIKALRAYRACAASQRIALTATVGNQVSKRHFVPALIQHLSKGRFPMTVCISHHEKLALGEETE